MVKHARGDEVNPSLPHVRWLCQLEALTAGSQQRDLHQAVSLLVSQQGALSRAGERCDPSPEKDTDAYPAVEVDMLMLSSAYTIKPNSSAVLIGADGPVSQQFL